jgi:pantoate--beta-alanine ligase
MGHLALIEACKKKTILAVCSIFVNPTQFNNPADFSQYPNTVERDVEQLVQADCSGFIPAGPQRNLSRTIYRKALRSWYLETVLEGKVPARSFSGVCQAVDRFCRLWIRRLFTGQKDYQQCLVIKKLLSLTGTTHRIKIISTKREQNGAGDEQPQPAPLRRTTLSKPQLFTKR